MRHATTFAPAAFPAAVRQPLLERLGELHAQEPLGPGDVRATARRVLGAARGLGLEPRLVRGGVDLGGAELDHVFVVVDDRVVDAALPVHASSFLAAVRAWVAGDLDMAEIVARAAEHGLEERVMGEYPAPLTYRGAPLWGEVA